MFTAFIEVILGWGYTIQIDNSGVIVESYEAGDSPHDSSVFGTGQASREELKSWATSTAIDMLEEHGAIAPHNIELEIVEGLEVT